MRRIGHGQRQTDGLFAQHVTVVIAGVLLAVNRVERATDQLAVCVLRHCQPARRVLQQRHVGSRQPLNVTRQPPEYGVGLIRQRAQPLAGLRPCNPRSL